MDSRGLTTQELCKTCRHQDMAQKDTRKVHLPKSIQGISDSTNTFTFSNNNSSSRSSNNSISSTNSSNSKSTCANNMLLKLQP